jgi:hypothetical protein
LNLNADTYSNVGSLLSLELFHELGAGENLLQAEPAEFPPQIFAAIKPVSIRRTGKFYPLQKHVMEIETENFAFCVILS